MLKRLSSLAFVIVLISASASAQSISPNTWRGLVLDESTQDDVIEKFGPTKKIKENQKLDRTLIDKLLSRDVDKKIFTRLHYETIEDFDDVKFYFKDDVLVMILLEPEEKPRPNSVVNAYGVPFSPRFHSLQMVGPGEKDFERDGQGNIYAKDYPTYYHLIANTEQGFIVLGVENGSVGKILGQAVGLPENALTYPGKTGKIQLISKSLEDRSAEKLLN